MTSTADNRGRSRQLLSFGEPTPPRAGYDVPLPNGCWLCIGCGVILPKSSGWNQCTDCDTRDPEDY